MPRFDFKVIEATLETRVGVLSNDWNLKVGCELQDLTIRDKDKKEITYFRSGGAFMPDGNNANYISNLAEKGMPIPCQPVIGLLYWNDEVQIDDFDFEPASIFFEIALPKDRLAEVIVMAQTGHYPNKISVETPFDIQKDYGLNYGWEPDASSVEWNTEAFPRVPLVNASVEYKILESNEVPESGILKPNQPPTTQITAELLPALIDISNRLKLIVILLVIIAGVVLFRG